MSFRCAAASLERDEPMAGTASTVRAFLLVEHPGPWGIDAPRDARLPDGLGEELSRRSAAAKVRALLVRRPRGGSKGATGVRVFAGYAHRDRPWLETTVLDDIHGIHDLDVEALGAGRSTGLTPHDGPVLAVCTHGRHDTCCAERGRPAVAALLERHAEQTWEVSHIGGDRYAANMLVLPWGFYYGRLDAIAAPAVADALLAGEVELDHLRGRSSLALPLQAAEIALRRHLDEHRLDAVRFVSRSGAGDRTDAVFDVAGSAYSVAVRSTRSSDLHRLTCRAVRENPVMEQTVLEIRPA